MARALAALLALAAAVLLPCAPATAHPGHKTSAILTVERPAGAAAAGAGERRVLVRVSVDPLAFALNDHSVDVQDGAQEALLARPDAELDGLLRESHRRFERTTHLLAGGVEVPLTVTSGPTLAGVRAAPRREDGRVRLPIAAEFVAAGVLPPGARSVTVRLPEIVGDTVLTVERPGDEAWATPLGPSQVSPDIPLGPAGGADAPGAGRAGGGSDRSVTPTTGPGGAPPVEPGPPRPDAAWRTFLAFAHSGFLHIVPHGLDHVLFVLGLFLGARTWRALLLNVTAFTLAHSVTLGLAAAGLVRAPGSIVEPLIALSIAAVAVENVVLKRDTRRAAVFRTSVVFVFGLVHGMGFAAVLGDTAIPRREFLPALVAFNIGVELGQLAVVSGAGVVLWWWRERQWYRPAVVVPLSVAIGGVGLWWAVERLAG